jgi:hypothetical protein
MAATPHAVAHVVYRQCLGAFWEDIGILGVKSNYCGTIANIPEASFIRDGLDWYHIITSSHCYYIQIP